MAKKFLITFIGIILITTIGVALMNVYHRQALLNFSPLQEESKVINKENLVQENFRPSKEKVIKAVLKVGGSSYETYLPEGSNVYDLMNGIAAQYPEFHFKGRNFPGLGFFVEEINGVSQNKKEGFYWIYYINNKVASVGVSNYKIKENDVITWNYEKEH